MNYEFALRQFKNLSNRIFDTLANSQTSEIALAKLSDSFADIEICIMNHYPNNNLFLNRFNAITNDNGYNLKHKGELMLTLVSSIITDVGTKQELEKSKTPPSEELIALRNATVVYEKNIQSYKEVASDLQAKLNNVTEELVAQKNQVKESQITILVLREQLKRKETESKNPFSGNKIAIIIAGVFLTYINITSSKTFDLSIKPTITMVLEAGLIVSIVILLFKFTNRPIISAILSIAASIVLAILLQQPQWQKEAITAGWSVLAGIVGAFFLLGFKSETKEEKNIS